ncbi:unnamed protein product [Clavelina lepadiformis]|uniref:Uncharacterized protein n=1 Tax=Clavelina lepadiformis TaxID=159417 RepID=A0ABP0FFW6_CLALP
MTQLLAHIFTFFTLGAFACVVTSLATPHWASNPDTGFSTGLHTYCNMSRCYPYTKEDKTGAFFAGAFFVWCGVFAAFFALSVNVAWSYHAVKQHDTNKVMVVLNAFTSGVSGLLILVAMIVLTILYSTHYVYGYSYYCGWAAFGICSFVCLLGVCIRAGFKLNFVSRFRPKREDSPWSDFDNW